MAASEAAYNGNQGGNFRLRLDSYLVQQSGNSSLIRLDAHWRNVATTSWWNYDPTYANYQVEGQLYNTRILAFGSGGSTYGAGQVRFFEKRNWDLWVGHNNNGTKTVYPYAYHNMSLGGSGGPTDSATQHTFGLPTIPRYAAITSWSLNTVTEKSLNVSLTTDVTCDLVDYSINGGGWTRGYTGNFTSRTFTIGNLKPATTYSVKIRVRRQDSGLYSETGLKSTTTTAVTVTSFTIPAASDTTMELRAVTSHVADLLQYRVLGSSTWLDVPGDFTTKQFTATGLNSNQSYTWQLRARHKDSQTFTPIVTATGVTGDPQPLQPSNLVPGNGLGVSTLTPTLSWQYNATSPDSQTAFQIIVRRESDAVTIYDSGKTTGAVGSHSVPAGNLLYNVNYQWQVKAWSGTDIEGPYSELASFKTSQPPIITVTNPVDAETISTDAPRIEWTYADPEGTAQISFNVDIQRIELTGQTTGELVYSQTVLNTNATNHLLPAGTLINGQRYVVRVTATDSDGIPGTSTPEEFLVSFISPAPPSIELELSEDALFNRITVRSNKPEDDAFDTDFIRIYKRETGDVEWDYLTQVQAIRNPIDIMEDASGWSKTGVATDVITNSLSKQGAASLSFLASGAGTGQYDKYDSVGSLIDYDLLRLWIYTLDASKITSVTFKFGTDNTNYFSFTIAGADLANTVWKSIEVAYNQLSATGSPTLGSIEWKAIQVVSTSALVNGDLLVDNWYPVSSGDALFIYDYVLANNTSYEYSATSYSNRENLESQRTQAAEPLEVVYAPMWNTYLIPTSDESSAVIGFTDGKAVPSWATKTDTAYHRPVGARLPTVYVLANQKYREGSAEITFWDDKFGGEGLAAAKKLEAMMNLKPLMYRTWWGEIIYISIDGQVNIERMKGKAWKASFSFTEIGE